MTAFYVDLDAGSDGNGGTSWSDAKATWQSALTAMSAGDALFIRRTNGGTPGSDSTTGDRTLTVPGTDTNPTYIFGCKDGTTNEPPVDSDIAVRGTDTLPLFETTSGKFTGVVGVVVMHGVHIKATDRFFNFIEDQQIEAHDCEWEWNGIFCPQDGYVVLYNCDLVGGGTSCYFLARLGVLFEMFGGLVSGTYATTVFQSTTQSGRWIFDSVDLSAWSTKTLLGLTSNYALYISLRHCKTAGLSLGTPPNIGGLIEAIACTADTGLGSTDTVEDHDIETVHGTVAVETTAVRTGGANDGAQGWSYALTPAVNGTLEATQAAVYTPWVDQRHDGDGTSATLTVYIANSGAADYNEDDVWLEVLYPDDAGTAIRDLAAASRDIVPGGATAVTDDTGSTWGTGAGNDQKLTVSLAPDYIGTVSWRVRFMKRFAASPETLYVDPKGVIA